MSHLESKVILTVYVHWAVKDLIVLHYRLQQLTHWANAGPSAQYFQMYSEIANQRMVLNSWSSGVKKASNDVFKDQFVMSKGTDTGLR